MRYTSAVTDELLQQTYNYHLPAALESNCLKIFSLLAACYSAALKELLRILRDSESYEVLLLCKPCFCFTKLTVINGSFLPQHVKHGLIHEGESVVIHLTSDVDIFTRDQCGEIRFPATYLVNAWYRVSYLPICIDITSSTLPSHKFLFDAAKDLHDTRRDFLSQPLILGSGGLRRVTPGIETFSNS